MQCVRLSCIQAWLPTLFWMARRHCLKLPLGEDEFVELDAEGNVKKSGGRKKKPTKKAAVRKKAGVKVAPKA